MVTAGNQSSETEFSIKHGLQQGTVNSPILFNIYTSDILNLFNASAEYPIQSIAFADDLIIYYADTWPSRIQEKLQSMFKKINTYYKSWRLKVNTSKCETILIRSNLNHANSNVRKHYKTFAIKENKESEITIPHKECVKYLGIHIDEKLKFNAHTTKENEECFL